MSSKSHPVVHKMFSEPFRFEIFYPETPLPLPVVFQTPILGRFAFLEDLFFERRFSRFFAAQGFFSVLIDRPIFDFDPNSGLEQIQRYLENSLQRNQAVLETIRHFKQADTSKMASFGMSFGAIINFLWASEEKRLKANAFALAGGNLPEIFLASQDPLMKSYRKAALDFCKGDANALQSSLQKIFTRDPLQAASKLNSEKNLLILAKYDRVVPYANGLALAEKFPASVVTLPFGHYLSVLAAPILKWKISAFLKEKLGSV